MTPEHFKDLLAKKDVLLGSDQLEQFDLYLTLLQKWNKVMNLTAITEAEEVYLKHFYDSLTPSFYEDFTKKDYTLCDIGSGAGFPSIPLKIAFPQLKITIVDALKKRINFLEEVVNELAIDDVELYHDRAELFGQNKQFRATFDYTTARAVANMATLAEFCLPLNKIGGTFIAMKGDKGSKELNGAKQAITKLGGKFREDIQLDLPQEAGERHLLVVDKKKETPNKYPRKPGTPLKKPIA